ncbi:hypothetical protein BGX21_001434 [Mortierella sp. AD011]|nr:hypothetical protein BGX20_002358 [Mortierella sp. AD010]KAF9383964.1 hypothetical protein BGX21_001434 [Mortierella sp. AD011]
MSVNSFNQQFPPPPPPVVLIVGAGIGGLLLGVLLEQINIPYYIFERAKEIKPLGAAITLGATILPVFEQLGMLEELYSVSLPLITAELYDEKIKKIGGVDGTNHRASVGYNNILFARPKLYEILLRRIPPQKLFLGKKVLKTQERDRKVHIFCSDNSIYQGDILVGADGAYSGVRQSLYRQLDEQGLLPKSDHEDLSVGYISMVGVATPKDPEKYPQMNAEFSHFSRVLGDGNRSWGVYGVAEKRICWSLNVQLSPSQAKDKFFRNSEWGPESNDAMIKEFQDQICPWGGVMGDLFNDTPKDLISKVYLEEKLFKTWYHGRIVLIGDACHKMLPGAGLGAVNAMQDAVVIANCLYSLPYASSEDITSMFEVYYKQRYHRAAREIERSKTMSKMTSGQTWVERTTRYLLLNCIPTWMQTLINTKNFEYRPQVAWLPLVENRGTGRVLPQEGVRRSFYHHQQDVQVV